jgi:hypothetical protein
MRPRLRVAGLLQSAIDRARRRRRASRRQACMPDAQVLSDEHAGPHAFALLSMSV